MEIDNSLNYENFEENTQDVNELSDRIFLDSLRYDKGGKYSLWNV